MTFNYLNEGYILICQPATGGGTGSNSPYLRNDYYMIKKKIVKETGKL
jgi:hypothetical protein